MSFGREPEDQMIKSAKELREEIEFSKRAKENPTRTIGQVLFEELEAMNDAED